MSENGELRQGIKRLDDHCERIFDRSSDPEKQLQKDKYKMTFGPC